MRYPLWFDTPLTSEAEVRIKLTKSNAHFRILIITSKIGCRFRYHQDAFEFVCARICLRARTDQLCLVVNNQEKLPLAASNDLWGQNEYASNLNEVKLKGVYEVKFLAKISHFGVKREQTCDKQTEIALIYIDLD